MELKESIIDISSFINERKADGWSDNKIDLAKKTYQTSLIRQKSCFVIHNYLQLKLLMNADSIQYVILILHLRITIVSRRKSFVKAKINAL